ncbi:MAG: WecB/TagA/CpsF family glycosyltransferase [bacterium]
MKLGEIELCGQLIFSHSQADCIALIKDRSQKGEQTLIATPNPEILLASIREPEFASRLACFDLRTPDGFGLKLVGRLIGKHIFERISGSDLLLPIAKIAAENGWAVVLIGGDELSNKGAEKIMLAENPGLKTVSLAQVIVLKEGSGWSMPDGVQDMLLLVGPCVVMVGLGMKKQEEWILQHLRELPDVKIAIGCGGAFAMIAGTLPRAPAWMRNQFEWLWRLYLEPKRLGRIINAVFIFPIRALIYEFITKR